MFDFFNPFNRSVWIGLKRPPLELVNSTIDPQEFDFIDGTEASDFVGINGEFPWGLQRPNNILDDQRCWLWFAGDDVRVNLAGLG